MAALAPLKRLGRGLAFWAAGDFLPVSSGGTGATTAAGAISSLGIISSITPAMDGTAAAGSSGKASDAGHVHPTDASRAPVASPAFTGVASAQQFVGTSVNGGAASAFLAQSNVNCAYGWYNSGAATDAKKWSILTANGTMYFTAVADSETNNTTWLQVTRSGSTVTSIAFGGSVTAPIFAPSTSLNLPSYTVATLPAAGTVGRTVYCTNCRVANSVMGLEAAGQGTGGLVTDNGTVWRVAGTNVTAST